MLAQFNQQEHGGVFTITSHHTCLQDAIAKALTTLVTSASAFPGLCLEALFNHTVVLSHSHSQRTCLQDAITHALTALLTSASASPDLCLEALELVLLSLSPSFHTAAALPASAPGAALNSARLEVGSAAAENGSEGQQQNQQQQEKLQGLLLPAFQLLVKRVPAERGVLTVQLLFKAVQAFQVGMDVCLRTCASDLKPRRLLLLDCIDQLLDAKALTIFTLQAGATGVTSSMLDSLTTALLLPGISQSSAPQQQEEG